MRAYPQELRDRVLAALGRGEKASQIARRLEVSRYFVYQVRDRFVLESDRGVRQLGGYRRSAVEGMESTIQGWLKAEPDLTLQQMCDRLAAQGRVLKVPALWHQLNKWNLSLKEPCTPSSKNAPTCSRQGMNGRPPRSRPWTRPSWSSWMRPGPVPTWCVAMGARPEGSAAWRPYPTAIGRPQLSSPDCVRTA